MRPPVFIGDEVSAAGFRLAGMRVHVPALGEEESVFRAARTEADLVLLSAETAQRISPETLRRALLAREPLVLVVPDVRGRASPPDPAAGLRRQLGLSE